ncbi:MAG: DUF3662 and FHA domain-containing protein [Actinobacteria bacterium]|nr:DUF3662 and FHA domain-containing protein [Actinomycetota bacterium]
MGLLDNLEQRLDRIVNGSFSKAFKSEVQPVELGAALQQEIDNRADTITGQTVVPNIFIIELGSVDHERLETYFETLSVELGALADAYSSEQRYTTVDSAHISFDLDPELETGVFRIRSTAAKRPADVIAASLVAQDVTPQVPLTSFTPEATPYLTSITGEEFKITKSVTNIGRGVEADIQIDDTSVSRLHCEIVLGSEVFIRDLGSTNGTVVDGARATESILRDGSIIKVGNITLTYMSK